jgi:glutaredoxin 2
MIKGGLSMSLLDKLKNKFKRLNTKHDTYQEAITFSEAGIHDHMATDESVTCEESPGRNIVVVSNEIRFPDEMMTYALEMAKRLDYGVIAVNAANITHEVTDFFSTTHDKLFTEFKETATQNVETFRKKADDLGLKFSHTVQSSNIDHAIENISKECGQIELVISENRESVLGRDILIDENRVAQRLCVYSVN